MREFYIQINILIKHFIRTTLSIESIEFDRKRLHFAEPSTNPLTTIWIENSFFFGLQFICISKFIFSQNTTRNDHGANKLNLYVTS